VEIAGEYRIGISRKRVWLALNDPVILQRSIPGCELLEPDRDNAFQARVRSSIGPVKARFNVRVSLENVDPPYSYTLNGEGQAGVAGFARGSADVFLDEDEDVTVLRYSAQFRVGGKLAQVGSRLVLGATRRTADQFFANFVAQLDPDRKATEIGGGRANRHDPG
jgi:carbon monoxide dehydrogenase subunit G